MRLVLSPGETTGHVDLVIEFNGGSRRESWPTPGGALERAGTIMSRWGMQIETELEET